MLPSPDLPPADAAVVAAARDLSRAIDHGAGPQGPEERAGWLLGVRQAIDALEGAFLTTLAEFDAAGDGQVLHAAASTGSWLQGALGMARGQASEHVRIARGARDELAPAVAAMVTDVPVTFPHVRAIHATCRKLPPSLRQHAAEHLTGLAHQLGVDDLRAAGAHLRHVADPDGSARHAEEDFGRRWLSLSPLLDGMHSIDGVLDAETAGSLTAALAPYLVPAGPDDQRTTDQRRADGIAAVIDTAVRSEQLPTLSGASVALQVQVPFATLTGDGVEPAQLISASSTPVWLTPVAAGRLACDATVQRLLLSPTGIPLDLGRQRRVFSSAQRKALATRDGGCRFPGCTRGPAHTDAHHIVGWARGGATDLANGLLLCRHHHRTVHEGGWTIGAASAQGASGPLTFTSPNWQIYDSPLPTRRATGAGPPGKQVA